MSSYKADLDCMNLDERADMMIEIYEKVLERDIAEKRTKRQLGNLLYHDLRKISNRKENKYYLETLESEGKKYSTGGKSNLIPFITWKNDVTSPGYSPDGDPAPEGTHANTVNKSEEVGKYIASIAVPIPPTSIFIPESTGVTYAMFGKSYSGKTTFVVNGLNKLTEDQLRHYNVIVFFTESSHAEPLKDLAPHVKTKMVLLDRFCPKLLLAMKRINDATKNMFKFLVIFDDILKLRGELVTKCVATLRNSNISTAISIQHDKFINPAQRNSVHNMYIFNLRSEPWEYMLRGFILGNVRELIPPLKDTKSVMKVAQALRENMDEYILYYDQRKDKMAIWNKIS